MSTRSYIARKTPSGYEYRYHHFDGYLGGVGNTLLAKFNTKEFIDKLFEIEYDLSSINSTIEKKKTSPNTRADIIEINGMAVEYYGDDGKSSGTLSKDTPKTLNELLNHCNEEYLYLFNEVKNKWIVKIYDLDFVDLKTTLKLQKIIDSKVVLTGSDMMDGFKINISAFTPTDTKFLLKYINTSEANKAAFNMYAGNKGLNQERIHSLMESMILHKDLENVNHSKRKTHAL